MMKTRLSILGLIFFIFSTVVLADAQKDTIADRIKTTYETQLFTLIPYVQRHYALRMYRLSGDEKFLYPIITDMMVIANLLNKDINGLTDLAFLNQREQIILNRFNLTKEKHKRRHQLLKQHPQMAFSLALLANINMLHEVGLLNTEFFPNTELAINYLKKQDFSPFFLNHQVIEIYSPQLATYVVFLSDLGIAEIKEKFLHEFQKVFMHRNDQEMSTMLYGQKLYGLTHVIIAASRNYQRTVNKAEFNWVYEYFEKNIDTILKRAKPDIVAEVGIAFLLAGENEHPVVEKTRRAVAESFNHQLNMIPSSSGGADLSSGEHRNALAIMLLTWPDKLYPGPDLKASNKYQQFWLKNYLP